MLLRKPITALLRNATQLHVRAPPHLAMRIRPAERSAVLLRLAKGCRRRRPLGLLRAIALCLARLQRRLGRDEAPRAAPLVGAARRCCRRVAGRAERSHLLRPRCRRLCRRRGCSSIWCARRQRRLAR